MIIHTLNRKIFKLLNMMLEKRGYELTKKSYFTEKLNELLQSSTFYFIQVGAHDGVRFDSLYQKLTEYNVHGIVIEPIKKYYNRLAMNYEDYPFVIPLNMGLHASERKAILHFVDPMASISLPTWSAGIGSFIQNHYQKTNIPSKYIISEEVECRHFMDLINEYQPLSIDLLQIDVEGYDFEILKMVDFKQVKPKLIKYEYVNLTNKDKQASISLLKTNGYKIYFEAGDAIGILND
jgi:FkbM family methyltransferase